MQIVIDISAEDFEKVKYGRGAVSMMRKAIQRGIPLPKGHGRLIDVNDILDRIGLEDNDENREENVCEIITLEDFDFIPTIIEADTAESEDKE